MIATVVPFKLYWYFIWKFECYFVKCSFFSFYLN